MAKKNYYGFQKSKMMENRDTQYVPQGWGKVVMMIAAPSALVSMLSVMALFFLRGNAQGVAMVIALITFAISFIGSIFMMVDVIRFHRKKSKKYDEKNGNRDRILCVWYIC